MQTFHLESTTRLELCNVLGGVRFYRGRPALRLIEQDMMSANPAIAVLSTSGFKDGILETAIAGSPRAEASTDIRGFVGIAFRVQPQGSHFEYFFIRPTNGRTINCAAIIQPSTAHILNFHGSDSEM